MLQVKRRNAQDKGVLRDVMLEGQVLVLGLSVMLEDKPYPARAGGELGQGLPVKIQPAPEDVEVDLAEGLADLTGDADADQILEAGHVGAEIGVQVVGGERAPEEGVLGGFEEGGELGEFLDGLGEVGGGDGGGGVAFEGGG
ncbi:hypothetical protein GJ744_000351 [Endocarpon pusillum]|uniref:Uncharacterized protein n=1 Tax=Endocarpon pusillum TaxID=364733 RepID=A0A8H7E716_9EURO|nr:hypothetical protein GJ744_000351 [Endocarpon pusillum]